MSPRLPARRAPTPATLLATALTMLLIGLPALPAAAQYAVGTADATWTDAARGGRAVPVDLYYPATAAGAGQPVAAPPSGGFGAVSIGHGYQMAAGLYAWLAQRLAAIGCVVAVPRTGGELFPNHATFALDLAFAARAARDAGADAGSPFFGRMNTRALVMGHSLGGGCSLLAAAGDPSLTAVANLAAAETSPSAIAACAAIARPTLLLAGANDCVTPPAQNQAPMYDALAGTKALATLTGGNHCQFAASSFACSLGDFCAATITRQQQQDLVWHLLEPWVRWVLLHEADAGATFEARLAAGAGFTARRAGGLATAGGAGEAPDGAADAAAPGGATVAASPNPFNPATGLTVTATAAGPAVMDIVDVRGCLVRRLFDGSLPAGATLLRWDGRDDAGRAVAGGAYVARLARPGAPPACAKLLLLK